MPRAGLSSWKPSGFRLLLSGLAPRTTTARISLMLFLVILAGSALLLILLERATQTQLDREALRLFNSVVFDPQVCLDIDDVDTFTAAPTFNGVFMSCPTSFNADADDEAARFNAGTGNTAAGTNTLAARGSSTANFVNGANENGVAVQPIANLPGSSFLTAPTNIGAVSASNNTWYQGWTCSALVGEEAC